LIPSEDGINAEMLMSRLARRHGEQRHGKSNQGGNHEEHFKHLTLSFK
jgi:hypothetical protein